MNATGDAKIIIVDDHPLVREGLSVLLSSEQGFQVVGTAETGDEALSLCRKTAPDLVIVDIRMRGMDGFQTLNAIRRYSSTIKVLMLAGMPLADELARAQEMGAAGYVAKSAPTEEIVSAIRRALAGAGFQGQTVVRAAKSSILTRREVQVLTGMNEGLTLEQIAERLDIGFETVRTYAKSIKVKLGVAKSAAAIGKAHELGILQ